MNLDWIREKIPLYESIWALFIGHDGRGTPLKVTGLPVDQQRRRESFFQAHYTMLVCLVQARDALRQVDQEMQSFAPDSDAYLSIHREMTAFLAFIGQARDMFKKMDAALGLGESVCGRFQDLYQQRCSILHGSIPVHVRDEGFLMIPKLAGEFKSFGTWHDESLWSEAKYMKFDLVSVHLNEIFEDVLSLSQGALSTFLTTIKEMIKKHHARLEIPTEQMDSSVDDSLSGTMTYMHSGEA